MQPGPGWYSPTVGFGEMSNKMKEVNELKSHGVSKLSVNVIRNSATFKSGNQRFDDTMLS